MIDGGVTRGRVKEGALKVDALALAVLMLVVAVEEERALWAWSWCLGG